MTKQTNTAEDHSDNNTVLRIKGVKTFERVIFINSTIIFTCGLYVSFM